LLLIQWLNKMVHIKKLRKSQVVVVILNGFFVSYHQIVVLINSGLKVHFEIEFLFFASSVDHNECAHNKLLMDSIQFPIEFSRIKP
jgi:hypothetical protein